MKEKAQNKENNQHNNGPKAQNGFQTIVVREYESADKPHVQRLFYEGMMEMVPDIAFRGLRHHPESLLLYSAMTVACIVITMCWWMIGLLPPIVLCGRYFYSRRVIHGYLEHAMRRDMGDIEEFYTKASGVYWNKLYDSFQKINCWTQDVSILSVCAPEASSLHIKLV
ncbi:hypothetical protein PAMA_015922 [Pampus argenteus]